VITYHTTGIFIRLYSLLKNGTTWLLIIWKITVTRANMQVENSALILVIRIHSYPYEISRLFLV
jgi:hypothetical protein